MVDHQEFIGFHFELTFMAKLPAIQRWRFATKAARIIVGCRLHAGRAEGSRAVVMVGDVD